MINEQTDKKTKILLLIFIGLMILSIGLVFYKDIVLRDYEVIDSSNEII